MYLDTSYYRKQIDDYYNHPTYPVTQKEWDYINKLQKSVRRHSKTAMDELLCIFHPLFISTIKSLIGERETLNFISRRLSKMYNGYANLRCIYEDKEFFDIYVCISIGFIKCVTTFKERDNQYKFKNFLLSNLHYYIQSELKKYVMNFYNQPRYIEFHQLTNKDLTDPEQETELLKVENINYTDNPFPLKLKQHDNTISDDIFDIDWINGVTCNAPFDILTIREREMLVMFYIQDFSLSQISNFYNLSLSHIKNTYLNIKKKLRRVL